VVLILTETSVTVVDLSCDMTVARHVINFVKNVQI
jgi:hypothetical protein